MVTSLFADSWCHPQVSPPTLRHRTKVVGGRVCADDPEPPQALPSRSLSVFLRHLMGQNLWSVAPVPLPGAPTPTDVLLSPQRPGWGPGEGLTGGNTLGVLKCHRNSRCPPHRHRASWLLCSFRETLRTQRAKQTDSQNRAPEDLGCNAHRFWNQALRAGQGALETHRVFCCNHRAALSSFQAGNI